jgi:hypothetical protein
LSSAEPGESKIGEADNDRDKEIKIKERCGPNPKTGADEKTGVIGIQSMTFPRMNTVD